MLFFVFGPPKRPHLNLKTSFAGGFHFFIFRFNDCVALRKFELFYLFCLLLLQKFKQIAVVLERAQRNLFKMLVVHLRRLRCSLCSHLGFDWDFAREDCEFRFAFGDENCAMQNLGNGFCVCQPDACGAILDFFEALLGLEFQKWLEQKPLPLQTDSVAGVNDVSLEHGSLREFTGFGDPHQNENFSVCFVVFDGVLDDVEHQQLVLCPIGAQAQACQLVLH